MISSSAKNAAICVSVWPQDGDWTRPRSDRQRPNQI